MKKAGIAMNFPEKLKSYFTFADFVIAVVVCTLSLSPLVIAGGKEEAKTVVVELDGKVYASYSLQTLGNDTKEVVINSKYGKNTLLIDKNGADMIFSDCPLQIDVKHRKITSPGESIVCAPHKLVVYISGESKTDGISS